MYIVYNKLAIISSYINKRSAWGPSSPGKHVCRGSTPCQKRSQVWGKEIKWAVAKIYTAEMPVFEMRRSWKTSFVL